MESSAIIAAVAAAIGALVIGIFLGKMIFAKNSKKDAEEAEILLKRAETQAKKTLDDANTLAETIKEKKSLEASSIKLTFKN